VQRLTNKILKPIVGGAAVLPMMALLAMLIVLLVEAIPAVRYNGWGFFTKETWSIGSLYGGVVNSGGVPHLAGASYGALSIILGTLEMSAIAVIVGIPIAIGAAIVIVELLPSKMSNAISLIIEVLAGVPSVVVGLFGLLTFGPWLARNVYPLLSHMPNVPVLNIFRGSVGHGEGLLSAGLVLSLMIIPIVTSTTRELLRQVPTSTKEGALALGMTSSESFFAVQAPWIRTGVIGASVLGLGRALGETIAVALVSGSVLNLAGNIYGTTGSIASTIVTQLDSAEGDPSGLAVSSLAEAALVLFIITLLVNVIARFIVTRSAHSTTLPVGAGF